MKIVRVIMLLNFFSVIAWGQGKLILHRATEREVIKEGKLIGITLKGEDYKYKDWRKFYKCPNDIQRNLWVVDSIGNHYLYLTGYNYHVSIEHVFVLRKNLKTLKNKEYVVDSIIPSKRRSSRYDSLECGIASLELVGQKYKAVKYSDIESLTFAHKDIEKYKNGHGPFFHFYDAPSIGDSKAAAIVFLVILSVDLTICFTNFIIDEVEAQVHTYNLNDWKLKIKLNLP